MSNDTPIAMLRAPHLERRVEELSVVERSRKRKLRELYAVASHSETAIPSFVNLDAPDSQAPEPERRFLEANDIRKGTFHESTIPARRNLRSNTGKARASTPTKADERASSNQNRLNALLSAQRDNRESLQERTKGDATFNFGGGFGSPAKAPRLGDGPEKVAQVEVEKAQNPTQLLDVVVDKTVDDAIETANVEKLPDEPAVPLNALEKENIINNVENTPEVSNGVDPNVAIPRTAEDAANLPGPILNGDGDPNHAPAVVHLPPREVQEERLREQDEMRAGKKRDEKTRENTDANGKLTLQVPNPEPQTNGHHDAASSPGSSEAPLSATTANAHGSSADSSPDNEANRYDPDAMDVDKPTQSTNEEPRTPPELAPTEAEIKEKEQHDSRLKAQMELVRERILESSPVSADAQLLQEQAVAQSASATPKQGSTEPQATDGMTAEARELTRGTENAQQMMDDEEEDEVVGVPTPGEDKKTGEPAMSMDNEKPALEGGEPKVVGDEADAMDVDAPVMPKESQEAEKKEQEPANGAPTPESMPAADASKQPSPAKQTAETAEAPAQSIPARTSPAAVATPPIERMTTRVASGALKHKSVSEILGETPRQTPDKSRSGTSTPGSPAVKLRLKELAKEKERSKLSTVVFAKQPKLPLQDNGNGKAVATKTVADKVIGVDYPDYLMPVIQAQAYNKVRGFQPLEAMIASAHKTISTSNSAIPVQESQAQKIISRIHHLQTQEKWSLRQPKRAAEPNRPATHWDELLKEAKWMRTDFREERKWKMAFAKKVAHTCAMWVEGDAEERKLLERKVSKPKAKEDQQMDDVDSEIPHPTPDLVASSDNETPVDEFDDEPSISHLDAVAPTAIFSLDNDDLVFAMNKSPISDKLLQELPIYGQPLVVHRTELPTSTFDPDASWRKPYLPISKYIEGKIILKDDAPPRKKSRYEYDYESDDEDGVVFGQADRKSKELPADQIEVALFNPENRHLRDRIHAGHQFRPPSEFPMPLQSFFENRLASQWTWSEDDELKQLVREYQYNWSLISSLLASKSIYSSGAERRTPWECFERWITLEGLPADMVKTHYFRAYNNRIEAARRSLQHQAQLQAAQPAPAPGSAAAPLRPIRRSTDAQRVTSRRNTKHVALIDAMRKVAKKRETAQQKQQHAQNQANMRKQPDNPNSNLAKHTPQQISKLKHDRELQIQDRLQRTLAAQEQARRNQAAAIRNPQNPQGWPIGPNGLPQQPRGMQGVPQTPGMGGRPNNLAVPVPNHLPHVPMQSLQPGGQPGQMGIQGVPKMHPGMGQMPINGMPAAQMQGMQGMQGMQHGQRLQVPANANSTDINLVMQARAIAQNQRAAQQMQQSGQHAGQTGSQMHQSPPNNMRPMPNMGAGGQFIHSQSNPQSLAAQQAMHNFTNSPSNPQPPPNAQQQHHGVGAAQSPRPAAAMAQIEAQYRAKYPQATPDQIRKLVSDAVLLQERQRQQQQQLSQSAMHAAAGQASNVNMSTSNHSTTHTNTGMGMANTGGMGGHTAGQMPGQMNAPTQMSTPMQGLSTGMQNSPVQYAQMLRAQQERQAAAVAAAAAQAAAAQAANNGGQGNQNVTLQTGQSQLGSAQHSQANSQSPAMMNRGASQSQSHGTPQQSNLGLPQQNQARNSPAQAKAQMSPPQQPSGLQNQQNQQTPRMSPQMAAAQHSAQQHAQNQGGQTGQNQNQSQQAQQVANLQMQMKNHAGAQAQQLLSQQAQQAKAAQQNSQNTLNQAVLQQQQQGQQGGQGGQGGQGQQQRSGSAQSQGK